MFMSIEKLNFVRMSVLPKFIYRFNAIPIKIPAGFVNIDKMILKLVKQNTQKSKLNTEEEQIGDLTLPNFKTYYKATVINTVWYW